jgi:hypothetical protein
MIVPQPISLVKPPPVNHLQLYWFTGKPPEDFFEESEESGGICLTANLQRGRVDHVRRENRTDQEIRMDVYLTPVQACARREVADSRKTGIPVRLAAYKQFTIHRLQEQKLIVGDGTFSITKLGIDALKAHMDNKVASGRDGRTTDDHC